MCMLCVYDLTFISGGEGDDGGVDLWISSSDMFLVTIPGVLDTTSGQFPAVFVASEEKDILTGSHDICRCVCGDRTRFLTRPQDISNCDFEERL